MHKNHPSQWAMCPPNYFQVKYEINPWMRGNIGRTQHHTAIQQWQALYQIIIAYATVHLIPPAKDLPDMPFAANAGLVLGNIFIPAHFRFIERQGEEAHFSNWFREHHYQIQTLPENVYFEGEGDALFQPNEPLLWMGYGMRSDEAAQKPLQDILKLDITCLHLINPRFYHLDTCFLPLPGKKALYYPDAFDADSLKKLHDYFPPDARFEVSKTDAEHFACNAIVIENTFICNHASVPLREKLNAWGFEVITTPLSEFILAGGAAKCLALCLTN